MQVGGRALVRRGRPRRTRISREHVLDEIRARGPLGSRHFDGAAREGEMWGWKPAKQMLELLWNHGDLVVAGRQGFQRLYDLPERVLPREVLDAPTPSEPRAAARARRCGRCGRAARSPSAGIVEHWRLRGGAARVRLSWTRSSRRACSSGLPSTTAAPTCSCRRARSSTVPAPSAAVLLSPFDNLLWDRPFARRVLGFDHLIEVYKPAPSGDTATTSCRSSGATGSSAAPT